MPLLISLLLLCLFNRHRILLPLFHNSWTRRRRSLIPTRSDISLQTFRKLFFCFLSKVSNSINNYISLYINFIIIVSFNISNNQNYKFDFLLLNLRSKHQKYVKIMMKRLPEILLFISLFSLHHYTYEVRGKHSGEVQVRYTIHNNTSLGYVNSREFIDRISKSMKRY